MCVWHFYNYVDGADKEKIWSCFSEENKQLLQDRVHYI